MREQAGSRKPKAVVRLSEGERAELLTLVGSGQAAARTLTHARILLKADQGDLGPGWTDASIVAALETSADTVARVRQRYVAAGLGAALYPKPPARVYPRKLDGHQEAQLITLACSAPPTGRARWTLRLLADELVRLEYTDTVSYETVRQVLKQTS